MANCAWSLAALGVREDSAWHALARDSWLQVSQCSKVGKLCQSNRQNNAIIGKMMKMIDGCFPMTFGSAKGMQGRPALALQ